MLEPRTFSREPGGDPVTREQQLANMVGVFLRATDAHALALKAGNPHKIAVAEMVLDGARAAARRLLEAPPS